MRHARGERGMIGLAAAVASVVIVAVIGGALLVHAYSDTVRNLTRKDSIGYLADISSQITENVRTVTSQIFSAMETIERGQMTLVENGATLDELNGEMAEDRDRWNLSRLAYVDEDGVRCRNQSRPGSRFCGVHDELVMGEPGADIIDDADDLI